MYNEHMLYKKKKIGILSQWAKHFIQNNGLGKCRYSIKLVSSLIIVTMSVIVTFKYIFLISVV